MKFFRNRFKLEKNWRASGTGNTTYNTGGNHVIPEGKFKITVHGRGGTGTAASGGNFAGNNPATGGNYAGTNPGSGGNFAGNNPGSGGNIANYNPGSGGNYANTNPSTPGNPYYNPPYYIPESGPEPGNFAGNNPPTPGNPNYNPYVPGNANYNPYTPGNANYNPYTPGNAYYNPIVPGNANYNPYTPAAAGNPSTVMGETFPGSNTGGTPAPNQPPVIIGRYAVPDNAPAAIVVPSGGYVTVESE